MRGHLLCTHLLNYLHEANNVRMIITTFGEEVSTLVFLRFKNQRFKFFYQILILLRPSPLRQTERSLTFPGGWWAFRSLLGGFRDTLKFCTTYFSFRFSMVSSPVFHSSYVSLPSVLL